MSNWNEALDALTERVRMDASLRGISDWNRLVKFEQRPWLDNYLAGLVKGALRKSEAVYVSEEMCALLLMAAPEFEMEPLLESDLLVPSGFAYFARPLSWGDRQLRAMQWDVVRNDLDGDAEMAMVAFYDDQLVPVAIFPGDFRSDSWYREGLEGTFELWGLQYFAAFQRLTAQRVAVTERRLSDRATRRRASTDQPLEILVVQLRRGDDTPSPAGGGVDWSYRWLVNGHWRWQPYGDGIRRQIWIAPYIKGPDDKPLVLKRRVFQFAR